LYEKYFEREQIIKLFEIIDNKYDALSTELHSSLESKIKQFEEEKTMPLISNMELRGIDVARKLARKLGLDKLGVIL
jgi:hypothetical protein